MQKSPSSKDSGQRQRWLGICVKQGLLCIWIFPQFQARQPLLPKHNMKRGWTGRAGDSVGEEDKERSCTGLLYLPLSWCLLCLACAHITVHAQRNLPPLYWISVELWCQSMLNIVKGQNTQTTFSPSPSKCCPCSHSRRKPSPVQLLVKTRSWLALQSWVTAQHIELHTTLSLKVVSAWHCFQWILWAHSGFVSPSSEDLTSFLSIL